MERGFGPAARFIMTRREGRVLGWPGGDARLSTGRLGATAATITRSRYKFGSAAKKFFVSLENLGHHIPDFWGRPWRLWLMLRLMPRLTKLQGFLLGNALLWRGDAWAGCHKILPSMRCMSSMFGFSGGAESDDE